MRKVAFFGVLFSTLFLHAQNNSSNDDMEALRKWLRDKRMISVKEIGGDLSISGEVRAEFQYANERKNDIQQYGTKAPVTAPRAAAAWDVEVNLMLDYRTDYTWASIKIEYDNDMGSGTGTLNKLKVERAYLGGRIVPGETFILDAEIGRRFLYNSFESKLEFSSLFDGILIRLSKTFDSIGNFYLNGGPFLINDLDSHYGYVAELGALRIANLGLNLKYSIIDWRKHYPSAVKNRRYDFLVSQLLVSYLCNPTWASGKLVKAYAMGVVNHLAEGVAVTAYQRANWGWDVGFAIGMVRKQGDWAIEVDYQWLQAQAVPDYDISGIGRGNVEGVGLYSTTLAASSNTATTISTAVGNGNFQGIQFDALYAFTDNLTMEQSFKISHTLNIFSDSSGKAPNITYKFFETEFIYGF